MSQTPMSSLESARRKFFMLTFLGSGGRNESNSHRLAGIGEKELDEHHV